MTLIRWEHSSPPGQQRQCQGGSSGRINHTLKAPLTHIHSLRTTSQRYFQWVERTSTFTWTHIRDACEFLLNRLFAFMVQFYYAVLCWTLFWIWRWIKKTIFTFSGRFFHVGPVWQLRQRRLRRDAYVSSFPRVISRPLLRYSHPVALSLSVSFYFTQIEAGLIRIEKYRGAPVASHNEHTRKSQHSTHTHTDRQTGVDNPWVFSKGVK